MVRPRRQILPALSIPCLRISKIEYDCVCYSFWFIRAKYLSSTITMDVSWFACVLSISKQVGWQIIIVLNICLFWKQRGWWTPCCLCCRYTQNIYEAGRIFRQGGPIWQSILYTYIYIVCQTWSWWINDDLISSILQITPLECCLFSP